MHYPLASLFLVLSGFGNLALGHASQTGQTVTPNPSAQSTQTAHVPAAPATTPAAAPSGPPPPNTLQDGTAIKLRLAETLSSANAKTGQQVSFETVEETDVDGVMIIAKGAQALATITRSEE